MTKRDYYAVLGVGRNAHPEEIKQAYRQSALKFHPDRNPGSREAEERFKEAAEAYSVLSDPEKRATYDRFGHQGLRGEGFTGFSGFDSSVFGDFEDILGSFFGFGDLFGMGSRGRRRHPQKGGDLALELEVTLEEAAAGVEKEVRLERPEKCPECRGSGTQPGTRKTTCPTCQGRGQVRYQQGFFAVSRTCSQCRGAGEIITSPCKTCRGLGRVTQRRTLKIKIPAGVDDGTRLRLTGEGEAGAGEAPAGDLYVLIRMAKHPLFEREGSDLFCRVRLTFSQAALGAAVEIPGLDGTSEVLKIPPGTQSGQAIKLKGRGLRELHGHRKGDLYVKVVVRTPDRLSKEEVELLRRLAELRGEDLDKTDRSLVDRGKNTIH